MLSDAAHRSMPDNDARTGCNATLRVALSLAPASSLAAYGAPHRGASSSPHLLKDKAMNLLRHAAIFQAFYEMMPFRRRARPQGPLMHAYRHFAEGDLADVNVLDTREYRSNQPCRDGEKSSRESPESSAATAATSGRARPTCWHKFLK